MHVETLCLFDYFALSYFFAFNFFFHIFSYCSSEPARSSSPFREVYLEYFWRKDLAALTMFTRAALVSGHLRVFKPQSGSIQS